MKNTYLLGVLLLLTSISLAQQATIKGIILDENNTPIPGVNISFSSTKGTQSNTNGFYQLTIPANKKITIHYSYVGFKKVSLNLALANKETYEFNPILKTDIEQIGQVILTGSRNKEVQGITNINPEVIRKIPGANAGVENLLKTLPGVSSNNELSTQYNVRGGNFDENLVYVNEIEVYRPFLIRSGQQEGLSFVNANMVRNVDFSAGGFQAKYGDKLSSVLAIDYRRPVDFAAQLEASLLGGSATIEGTSKNKKLAGILGVRYRDNSLFVNAKETETNFKPRFADAQTYITYQFSDKFELGFLGNIALNKYDYEPVTRKTNFGTLQNPKSLFIYYEGQEKDQYETYFGALKASYKISDNYTAKVIASVYNTQEQEYYDILGEYLLSDNVNTDIGGDGLGDAEYYTGVGSQLSHARNDLDALIANIEHKGSYTLQQHQFDYGVKYTHENIKDRIREYEVIDSAGFSIRPLLPDYHNNQPYEAYNAPLEPYHNVRAKNNTNINRLQAYLQWSYKTQLNNHDLWLNAGVRSHTWAITGDNIPDGKTQTVISPRAQIALKPAWKTDMLFRLSGGLYYQPPFYRELRDANGLVQPNLKAQQSIHFVVGNDYSFKLSDRPFKLTSEIYYKKLNDVNPYTVENVRIRYAAANIAKAYAYGLDMRLYGEFVPGTESWLSLGVLKTEENHLDKGYIARPTDQRLKVGLMFQDYVPKIPSLKVYLNLVYNTGLPGGSPSYADPYDYQTRLRDYRRADIGFSYDIVDSEREDKSFPKNHWLSIFKHLSIGMEIFNIFDNQNSITNTFVRDVYNKQMYSVPNYLSPRVFNVRLSMRF